MDLIIKEGIVLYDVKFICEDGKLWVYTNKSNILITGVDVTKYCLEEIGYKVFVLEEVK